MSRPLCPQCYQHELDSCEGCGVSICPVCDGETLCSGCDERDWNERLDNLFGPDEPNWGDEA